MFMGHCLGLLVLTMTLTREVPLYSLSQTSVVRRASFQSLWASWLIAGSNGRAEHKGWAALSTAVFSAPGIL